MPECRGCGVALAPHELELCQACWDAREGADDEEGTVWPDGTVRLPDAIESWLDGHFDGEKGDTAEELEAGRNVVAVALWSLIHRQGDPSCDQAALTAIARAVLVDTGWSCHPTPDGSRWFRFHDKNSVHMDGCQRVFVLAQRRACWACFQRTLGEGDADCLDPTAEDCGVSP